MLYVAYCINKLKDQIQCSYTLMMQTAFVPLSTAPLLWQWLVSNGKHFSGSVQWRLVIRLCLAVAIVQKCPEVRNKGDWAWLYCRSCAAVIYQTPLYPAQCPRCCNSSQVVSNFTCNGCNWRKFVLQIESHQDIYPVHNVTRKTVQISLSEYWECLCAKHQHRARMIR